MKGTEYWYTGELSRSLRYTKNVTDGAKDINVGDCNEICTAAFEVYQQARKILNLAIRTSKRAAWKELYCQVDQVGENPFGKPDKVVTKKFGGLSITSQMEPNTRGM